MKVLYYVEKELAQFDPARRMRERCEEQAWFDIPPPPPEKGFANS